MTKKTDVLSTLSLSSVVSIISNSQRTYLAILRTVAIISTSAIIIDGYWVLIILILVCFASILEFYNANTRFLEQLSQHPSHEDNIQIINQVANYSKTLYGYSLVVIIILLLIIWKYDKVRLFRDSIMSKFYRKYRNVE